MSRRSSLLLAVAVAISAPAARAENPHHDFPGLRQGQIHNPFSHRYHPLLPNTYRAAPFNGFCGTNVSGPSFCGPRFRARCGRCGGCGGCSCFGSVAFLPIGWPWTYSNSFFGWYSPWSSGYWFSAPTVSVIFVADANSAGFGPAAANRFAGGALAGVAPRQANDFGETRLARAASIASKAANDQSQRLLAAGDQFFREQKFDAALLRYRKAASAAPREAAPLVRRAMVHVAQTRYDLAAKSFRKALDVQPELATADWSVHELYGPETGLQRRHCEQVIAAAKKRPADGDAALVAGAMLALSRRAAEAQPWLARAAQSPDGSQYASAFQHGPATPGLEAPLIARGEAVTPKGSGLRRDEGPAPVTTLSQRLDP